MKILKTPLQIKTQMEFWVLKSKKVNHTKIKDHGLGFELFDLLDSNTKEYIDEKLSVQNDELIVFVLKNKTDEYIINTTKRFLKVTNQNIQEILYTEFKAVGLNNTASIQSQKLLKTHPEYQKCYLIKRNGNVIIWEILYKSINCFIQASKRCELIGRKYSTEKII